MKTTKIILGIGEPDSANELAEFAASLDFPKPEFEFFHAVPPLTVTSYTAYGESVRVPPPQKVIDAEKESVAKKLEVVASAFRSRGIETNVRVVTGPPAAELLRTSEEQNADMIVVGRNDRSAMDRLILGSVSHAVLVGAKTSVLVVRPQNNKPPGRISALIATDHSPYCERCIKRFQVLAPRGIERLKVLNVYPKLELTRLRWAFPELAPDFEQYLIDKLEHKTEEVASTFRELAPECSSKAIIGDPQQSVHETLEADGSQLLIVGAQGHHWLDRLSLGSFSYHAATEETCAVLVVRV